MLVYLTLGLARSKVLGWRRWKEMLSAVLEISYMSIDTISSECLRSGKRAQWIDSMR